LGFGEKDEGETLSSILIENLYCDKIEMAL
jgi:hypothetical protein